MPKFTESKTDRAYESFMQQIPGFQRDPPEAGIIQKDMKQKKQQKGAGKPTAILRQFHGNPK